MTIEVLNKQQVLAKKQLWSSGHGKTIGDVVESWNWNLSIFEIYDEIKEWDQHDIENILKYAYEYFNKDSMISELHSHLIGTSLKD